MHADMTLRLLDGLRLIRDRLPFGRGRHVLNVACDRLDVMASKLAMHAKQPLMFTPTITKYKSHE